MKAGTITTGSKWIRPARRLAIYLRDGFTCVYCERHLNGRAPRDVTLDHVVCRSKGGSNESTNLVTACRRCNNARGNKSIYEYGTEDAVNRIKRNTRRKLNRYMRLSKYFIVSKSEKAQQLQTL